MDKESDNLLNILLAVQVAIIIVNRKTHEILFANQTAAEISKIPINTMIGKKCHDFISPNKEGECPYCDLNQTIVNEEMILLRSDGSQCHVLKSVKPIIFKNIPCLLETNIDITDIKNANRETHLLLDKLKMSENRLNLAMTIADYGIWEIYFSNNQINFDSRFFTVAGYQPEEFKHEFIEWEKRIHKDYRRNALKKLKEISGGIIHHYDIKYRFLKSDGNFMWIRSIGQIVDFDDKGKPGRFIGIHIDIDERVIQEERFKLHNDLQSLLLIPGSLEKKLKQITNTIIAATKVKTAEIWILDENSDHDRSDNIKLDDKSSLTFVSSSGLNLFEINKNNDSFKKIIQEIYTNPHHLNENQFDRLDLENLYSIKLQDSYGEKLGILLLYSRTKIAPEVLEFLAELEKLTFQVIINDQSEVKFKAAMELTERANRLMEGREIRIRQIKEEINDLTKGLGWGSVYTETLVDPVDQEYKISDLSELRMNALSLAEDAEISRKEAEEISDQLTIIKHAVNNSSDAIAISTVKGDIFYINNSFITLFGYTLAHMASLSQEILFKNQQVFHNTIESLNSGISWQGQIEMVSNENIVIPVFMRAASFRDEKEDVLGLIWNFTDITEQKRNEFKIQQDLEEKKSLLHKAMILQQSFIQKSLPLFSKINVHALYLPCEKLGGDFFRILKGIHENKLVIVLGDCTDHGIRASMDASLLTSMIDPFLNQLYRDNRTDLFLESISREYMGLAEEDQFPTMLAMIIDYNNGEMYYSNANTSLPYIVRDSDLVQLEKAEGMHLGYFEDPVYERKKFHFEVNDKILLFSDAVLEFADEGKVQFGYKKFLNILKDCSGHADVYFNSIIKKLKIENSGFPLNDDTTLILLEYKGNKTISFKFNNLEEWEVKLDEIKAILPVYGFRENEIQPFSIALDELCINGYKHGNKEDISKYVVLEGLISCDLLEFCITDEGIGFDRNAVPDPTANLEALLENNVEEEYTHGRGLRVFRSYVDSVNYNNAGNCVTIKMKKKVRNVITLEQTLIY